MTSFDLVLTEIVTAITLSFTYIVVLITENIKTFIRSCIVGENTTGTLTQLGGGGVNEYIN